ncbi:DUF5615 family PIN-like protein [Nostoc sp. LEGE 06077]|uniref:DUF5615 family PIN-like protein n=1 Tax=Nostoc sp. LEGE 06077 TaxID=915325 RepID=UPI001882CB11|nr:DUF5615 family PIN-like protein [Nostoc sp. LEGE 06077]MBE9207214.1 DUF5615 family PIN-like protein [Nostoc sp. LEGE 06077]
MSIATPLCKRLIAISCCFLSSPFDQNLSRKLTTRLADIFPDSSHVQFHELQERTDTEIWEFAKSNNFCIFTQDADFFERSRLYGSPPKVIWLRCGNAPNNYIELSQALCHKGKYITIPFHSSC